MTIGWNSETSRRAIKELWPCLSCNKGQGAIEELLGAYLAALDGRLPPPDGRGCRFLPARCCRQPPPSGERGRAAVEAIVA
jgi:hypothetical protein